MSRQMSDTLSGILAQPGFGSPKAAHKGVAGSCSPRKGLGLSRLPIRINTTLRTPSPKTRSATPSILLSGFQSKPSTRTPSSQTPANSCQTILRNLITLPVTTPTSVVTVQVTTPAQEDFRPQIATKKRKPSHKEPVCIRPKRSLKENFKPGSLVMTAPYRTPDRVLYGNQSMSRAPLAALNAGDFAPEAQGNDGQEAQSTLVPLVTRFNGPGEQVRGSDRPQQDSNMGSDEEGETETQRRIAAGIPSMDSNIPAPPPRNLLGQTPQGRTASRRGRPLAVRNRVAGLLRRQPYGARPSTGHSTQTTLALPGTTQTQPLNTMVPPSVRPPPDLPTTETPTISAAAPGSPTHPAFNYEAVPQSTTVVNGVNRSIGFDARFPILRRVRKNRNIPAPEGANAEGNTEETRPAEELPEAENSEAQQPLQNADMPDV